MTINILLCDTFPCLLPAYIPSYESMFRDLFCAVSDSAIFRVFATMNGELPSVINRDEMYLITGCNRSVYEEEPWILELLQWIRNASYHDAYIVGICFGHQAIAQALGGKVKKYPGGWGVGIRKSRIIDDYYAKRFGDSEMALLYNHHDQVVRAPQNATVMATSDFCKYEAFRIGNRIFAFQGHPEYTTDYELHLLKNHSDNEDELVKRRAVDSIEGNNHDGRRVAKFLVAI
ncbi:MAG: hypothetical protein K6F33_03445 [Bacteroidales bacterium]|nr:hypothetical protein [Bacteroidales bacterium]